MAEVIGDRKVFSLSDVALSIEKTISQRYSSSFWVTAELNKLNYYSHSGHAYPDLVQKKDGKVIAQMRSNLWRLDFDRINTNFQKVLKEPLKDGIKILFLAKIRYDAFYGLALQILDIDPSYTLGDLEKEKQETIKKLKEQGIFNKNKTTILPLLPKRIAVISVETSNGYADFLSVIKAAEQQWGYKFFHFLFPSLLQGDGAVKSIINQLGRIKKILHHFDVVTIIRGGGGDVGLSCYNDYRLAAEVASFPIPVITGIGHSTNETVTEMVAYENAITPTKLAEFLIQKFHNFSVSLRNMELSTIQKSERMLYEERQKLENIAKLLKSESSRILLKKDTDFKMLIQILRKDSLLQLGHKKISLEYYVNTIKSESKTFLSQHKIHLENLEKNIEIMSPTNVLKRGYSITTIDGKSVTDAAKIKPGQELETHLYKGKLISRVESVTKTKKS